MNRENTGAKPTAPPRLPPEAEQEILEALFEGMEIHSSEIAAILKKIIGLKRRCSRHPIVLRGPQRSALLSIVSAPWRRKQNATT